MEGNNTMESQRADTTEATRRKVAVLFSAMDNGEELGLIQVDPSGMLVLRHFLGGPSIGSLRAVLSRLEVLVIPEPLYVKYRLAGDGSASLPEPILVQEAEGLAGAFNAGPEPGLVQNRKAMARVVVWSGPP